jgi:hypothetical protein
MPKEPITSILIERIEKSTLILKYREGVGKSRRNFMSIFFTSCKGSGLRTFFSSKGTPAHSRNPFKSQALFSPWEAPPSRDFPHLFRCIFLLAILFSYSRIRSLSWVSSALPTYSTLSISSSRWSIGEEVHFSRSNPCGREFFPNSLGRMPTRGEKCLGLSKT